MRIATNRRYTDSEGNKHERTDWHRIVVFGKQAEACANHLSKGRLIGVEGEMRSRQYDKEIEVGDQKTTVTMYVTECVASKIHFGPKPAGSSAPAEPEPEANGPAMGSEEPPLGEPDSA